VAGTSIWIAEVKSLTVANEVRQLRYGLGQILQYATTLAHLDPNLVLAVERAPEDPTWVDVCASSGVTLCWPDVFDDRLDVP
jgi:hypothetical protein